MLDGLVTLSYESLDKVRSRLGDAPSVLTGTAFGWAEEHGKLLVTDPWGSKFLLQEQKGARDPRGTQPGLESEPTAISDLTINVPNGANLEGIGRFYEQVIGCQKMPEESKDGRLVLSTGPGQTLTFQESPDASLVIAHEEMGFFAAKDGRPGGACNNGAHLSVYVRDLALAFDTAELLGVIFVNHRFKRLAYTKEEALDQCMFRVLDIIDPEAPGAGPIIRLEHEIRSATKVDGRLYKSAPFRDLESADI